MFLYISFLYFQHLWFDYPTLITCCMNWSWSVFAHQRSGGSRPTPMVKTHFFCPMNTGRGIDNKTCGLDNVFSTGYLWLGSDTRYTRICLYMICTFWLMGDGWPTVAFPSRTQIVQFQMLVLIISLASSRCLKPLHQYKQIIPMSAIIHAKVGFTHGLSLRTLECPRCYGNTCVLFTSQLRYSAGVFQALWLTDIIVFAALLHVTDSYSIQLSFGFWYMSMELHVAWSSVPSRNSNQC